MQPQSRTSFLTRFSLLLAIEALVCFTPLGSLPAIGPVVATLGMVPVIITAVTLGTGAGSLMGLFAGIFSLIVWTFMPPSPVVAFVFSPFAQIGEAQGGWASLFICIVPRVLVGTVAGLVFKALHRPDAGRGRDWLAYGLAGVAGSLANTFLVMGGVYAFFGSAYAAALGMDVSLLLGVIFTTVIFNGIPEAVIGGVAAFFVGRGLNKKKKS